jgi:lysine 2,3-aminomutase
MPRTFPSSNGSRRLPGGSERERAGLPFSADGLSVAEAFRLRCFPHVESHQWNDWRWQLRNRLRTTAALAAVWRLTDDERSALAHMEGHLPAAVTPYYASLADPYDPDDPVRRSMIPVGQEFIASEGEADDPLGEDASSPLHGLVHRYPDRVLFLVSDHCAVYCRYCTRSRVVGSGEMTPDLQRWEAAFEYLRGTPAVRDVLLSGGDPLTLSDDRLEHLLSSLRSIPYIDFVRIGSKVPAVLPQRITPELVALLRRYRVWLSVHFMHPSELTPEVAFACDLLADGGIPIGSQTVLLKGINDNVETMRELFHGLLRIRVKPYYLYQCDPITGSAHFRTPVEKGLEIIEGLRGHTTGYAVPQFVIDAPGGGGKIPLLPEYVVGREGDDLVLRNYAGETFRYHDPVGVTVGKDA